MNFTGATNTGPIFSCTKLSLHSLWDVPVIVLCWFLTILPQETPTDSLETELPCLGLAVPSNMSSVDACDIRGLSGKVYPGQWSFLRL